MNNDNRPRVDSNVYIVGIGVSVPAGLPMLDRFLKVAQSHLEYSQSGLGSISEGDRNESEVLKSVLEYAQSKSQELETFSQTRENLEHVFGILRKDRSDPSLSEERRRQLANVDRDLVYTIIRTCELCEQQHRLRRPMVTLPGDAERCTLYAGFARLLQEQDTVISFNYDLLLEQGFCSIGRQPDYRIPEAQVIPIGKQWQSDWPKRTLLKPHGSANWMVCENSNCQHIHLHADVFNNTSGHVFDKHCHACNKNAELRFVMVPPVHRKSSRRAIASRESQEGKETTLLDQVLTTSIERCRSATRVFVIGYSCPPSDESESAFITLLKDGLNVNPNRPVVIVVNPNAAHAGHVQHTIKQHAPNTDPQAITASCYNKDRGKFEDFLDSKEGRALMGR